jgi:hypothetical protein
MLVRIRGVTYESVRHAASAISVSKFSIYAALNRGTIDRVGLAPTQRKPIVLEGLSFPSIASAARALGLSEKYVAKVIATDSPTGMKRVCAAAVAYKQNMGAKE